jgi:hypothetical protein
LLHSFKRLENVQSEEQNLVFFNDIFKNVANGGTTSYSPLSFSTKKDLIAKTPLIIPEGTMHLRETFSAHDEVGGITVSCQYLAGLIDEYLSKPRANR